MRKNTFLKNGYPGSCWISVATVALVLTMTHEVIAQQQDVPTDTSFNIRLFNPSPGPLNFFQIESPEIGDDLTPSVGLMFYYGRRPFAIYNCSGENCDDEQTASDVDNNEISTVYAVENLLTMDILGSFNFLKYFQVGAVMPFTVLQTGTSFSPWYDGDSQNNYLLPGEDYTTVFAPGDLRFHVKGRFLGTDREEGISLAVAASISIPLWDLIGYGKEESGENIKGYGGDGLVSGTAPKILFGYRFSHFRFALSTDIYWRKKAEFLNAEIGHLWEFGGALGYTVIPQVELIAELFGNKTLNSKNFSDTESSSLMFLAGGRFPVGQFTAYAAGGGGIISGVGVPQFQFVVGGAWTPHGKKEKGDEVLDASDYDGDGIANELDKCPKQAEDIDEFEDEDGCPEFDNDQDGVPDGYDSCVNTKEDKDGFRDDDGCPDLDHDEDTIPEDKDKCPDHPEDFDGFEDDDGCPEKDNDKDGIEDADDFCPIEAEDKDGYEDDDGCPDLDNDGDGVADSSDKCPDKPETLNGYQDGDGCPDKGGKALVVITEKKIELKEMIQFKKNSDQITGAKSFEILDIVTNVLSVNTKLRVSIEGHTDNKGKASYNRKLSKRRADAVKAYLVSKGIAGDRLETVGYGPDKPITENKTRAGRAANRRVEFVIIQPETPAPSAAKSASKAAPSDAGGGSEDGAMDFTSD
jgi:OmpA-OmpF porin, OOP family